MTDQTEGTGGAPASGGKQSDVMIDTSETSRSTQKVELDLEDAPFLEEEEEVKPQQSLPTEPVGLGAEEKKTSGLDRKKKLMILGAVGLILLIAAAVTIKVLYFKGTAAPLPAKHAAAEPGASNATEKPELPELPVHLEPFWVEQKGEGDEIRFLTVRMMLTTRDPAVVRDIQMKLLPARNAIFYYLKNKDVQFLADEKNAEKLKSELLLVINQYVTDGKFDNLMFEEYVVK
jgi:flagellar protein FliL